MDIKNAIIWSKDNCPQCVQAKQVLESRGFMIEERKIGSGYSKEDLLAEVPTARSVPQIFIGEQLVGGLSQLTQIMLGSNNFQTA